MTLDKTADVVAISDLTPDTAGAIVLWRLSGETNYGHLKAAFVAQGVEEKLLPDLPSPQEALQRAMREHVSKRTLLRTLPGRRAGFALVDEYEATEQEASEGTPLRYRVRFTTRLVSVEGQAEPTLECSNTALAEFNKVVADYQLNLTKLTAEDTASWLSAMVRGVSAVPLRDTGGVYFVPRETLPLWRKLVAALKTASATYVAEIPALRSTEAIGAILDSLSREAAQQMAGMEEELKEAAVASLGGRAIKTRVGKCEAMAEKLEVYERLAGVSLDELRSRLEGLRANLAAAALIAHSVEAA